MTRVYDPMGCWENGGEGESCVTQATFVPQVLQSESLTRDA
ncbi:hypothetical protein JOD24_001762 [Kroppenstedtia sanguinis]